MIQCAPVRAIALILVWAAAAVAEERAGVVGIYWEPPGAPAPGGSARAAFADALRPLGARVLDAAAGAAAAPPLLAPALDAAKAEYARFQFAAALAHLDELARLADAQGGGELDDRQLSEIFLYRGLARLETGAEETAWDDLVRAARLDPARVMDPARFPPRAVATYKRAVAEVAQLPRAELAVEAPPDALVRVDGAAAAGALSVTLGQHFVTVEAQGFERWASVVSVASARARVAPPLRAWQPPEGDRLLALAGEGASRVVLGALVRAPSGWRFVARDITLPDGKFVSDAVALGDAPVRAAVQALVRRLITPSVAAPVARAPRRWWPWVVAGGGAVVAAVAITLGVVLGGSSPTGTAAGTLGLAR
jgi:hypothetical protein